MNRKTVKQCLSITLFIISFIHIIIKEINFLYYNFFLLYDFSFHSSFSKSVLLQSNRNVRNQMFEPYIFLTYFYKNLFDVMKSARIIKFQKVSEYILNICFCQYCSNIFLRLTMIYIYLLDIKMIRYFKKSQRSEVGLFT